MPLTCPMCAEYVDRDDVDCPYCGEPLSRRGRRRRSYGLWRDGNILVMEKNVELPNRCIKSNEPTEQQLKRPLSWHPPALNWLFLAGLLPYAIVVSIMRKTATVYVGLSEEWRAKRRRAIMIGWVLVLLGVGMLIGGLAYGEQRGARGRRQTSAVATAFAVSGLPMGIFGMFYGVMASRMVSPKRITDTHVWLKGACPEFLDRLPEWQGEY